MKFMINLDKRQCQTVSLVNQPTHGRSHSAVDGRRRAPPYANETLPKAIPVYHYHFKN